MHDRILMTRIECDPRLGATCLAPEKKTMKDWAVSKRIDVAQHEQEPRQLSEKTCANRTA